MTKDVYKVIENPNNFIFRFEVWMKGVRIELVHGSGRCARTGQVERRIDAYKTREKAEKAVKYWEELQNFKGENSSAENSIMNNEEMREAYV